VTDASQTIHRYDEIGSTQDEARRLLEEGRATKGHVVIAKRQTAGRGRFGRLWVSPKGGFYATFILPKLTHPSIRVGLAFRDALRRLGISTQLKWPNDLLIGEKKLGGILVEEACGLHLAGVGINLSMPPLPTSISASQCNGTFGAPDLLAETLGFLTQGSAKSVLEAYRSCCATLGRQVRIHRSLSEAPLEGRAVGIDDEGHLLVEMDGDVVPISGGECIHLRSPAIEDR